MESNYYGPVQDVLAEDPTRTKRVGMSLSLTCVSQPPLTTRYAQWTLAVAPVDGARPCTGAN
jgi:hypothetical protein